MNALMDNINDMALDLAGSPWVFIVVLAFVAIDAFFPPIPSESVVVALAAIGASSGEPNIVLLAIVAAAGALLGDNIAYRIGRIIDLERHELFRRRRIANAVQWARAELDKRAALLILTARYVPVGRVAVNTTAGATRFPFRRFFPLAVLAAASWSLYSVLIGVLAGNWAKDNPLLGAAVAIVLAMTLGYIADRVMSRRRRREAGPASQP